MQSKVTVLLLTMLATQVAMNITASGSTDSIAVRYNKDTVVPVPTLKVYEGVNILHILNFSIMCMWIDSFATGCYTPWGKSTWHPLYRHVTKSHRWPEVVVKQISRATVVSEFLVIHPLASQSLNWVQLKSSSLQCVWKPRNPQSETEN
jgi:hypothetical protein